MAEQAPVSEFDRVLAEIARKRLGDGAIPPPPSSAPAPAESAVPGSGPSSIFAGPISTAAEGRPPGQDEVEETWEDATLTEAEATVVPKVDEVAADAVPAVGASALHPEVEIAAHGQPLPPAGWYPDPHNALYRRWWNGQSWTDQVQAILRNRNRSVPGQSSQKGWEFRNSLRGLADDLDGGHQE